MPKINILLYLIYASMIFYHLYTKHTVGFEFVAHCIFKNLLLWPNFSQPSHSHPLYPIMGHNAQFTKLESNRKGQGLYFGAVSGQEEHTLGAVNLGVTAGHLGPYLLAV